ncbi:hypothetical protein [Undibacterium squillarum]|uniref:Sigma-70 family RNA polymerase sigma factor n=1 Tax=Undibacterium squillarum TaxID=1131567 RepID=A0ABQ2Y221_9BURK|nr:hypothetical protein [Undibacterium squillarum]GGX53091.1 hypothetical protein GCM10010946_34600 [Undibacterium squillarum]
MQQKRVVRAASVQRDPVAVAMERAGFDQAGNRVMAGAKRAPSLDYALEDRLHNWGMVRGMNGRDFAIYAKPADMPFWVQRFYQYQQSLERQLAISENLFKPVPALVVSIEKEVNRAEMLLDAERVERAWRSLPLYTHKEILRLYYITGYCMNKIRNKMNMRGRQHLIVMASAKRELKSRLDIK